MIPSKTLTSIHLATTRLMASSSLPHVDSILQRLEQATTAGQLTPAALENVPRLAYRTALCGICALVAAHVRDQKWQTLDDVFWTIIPFGTGGRRGRMYPIGTNAINDRTIGESAQGLAHYVLQWKSASGTRPPGSESIRRLVTDCLIRSFWSWTSWS